MRFKNKELLFLSLNSFTFLVPLKTHFRFSGWLPQFFPGGKTNLAVFRKGFDLVLAPEGGRIIGLGFLEDQLHGPVGGGVLASLARIVGLDALLNILGDAGVIGTVRAFGDI